MHRYIGLDGNHTARVWADGETATQAAENCKDAIIEYVRRRPDTGPLSAWYVLPASFRAALPVDISTIEEYGLTQKLSNSIRCF